MTARLTKPLIVPEYKKGLIKLYTPDVLSGIAAPNPSYTIDLQAVLNSLFPMQVREAGPNCCKLNGVDLFVAQSTKTSQAIIKFPGYLSNPAAARANAFVFTLDGQDYVDIAFDKAGRLYVAEGEYGNNNIYRYGGVNTPFPEQAAASRNNYNGKVLIGNAGLTSYFANLAFDAAGNLWVSDYLNDRVVAFDVGNLGTTNSFHVLSNPGGALAVANSDPGLKAPTSNLFAQPEGLDFDDFTPTANLWVANNNVGQSVAKVTTTLTTIVKITKALQTAVLGTTPNSTLASSQITANVNCFIYQVANGAAGRPQFGGLQVDKAAGRLYVNEQVNGNGRAFELATIAATKADPADSLLAIVSTNPGNGGIALLQLGAYLADNSLDRGYEPDTTSTRFWETLAISVTQNSAGGPLATLPPSEEVNGGQNCFLYIQVQNFGPTPTLGIETLNLSWAKASSGPGWPAPWDGTIFDVPTFPTSAMGGLIADSVSIPVVPAFGSVVVGPVPWITAPDPKKYNVKDGHFCLLARIVTPGLGALGMSYPEGNNLGVNVLNNARIVQRNIHIITLNPAIGPKSPVSSVLVSNYTGGPMRSRLAFELLDSEGRPLRVPAGRVLIGAEGVSLKALLRSSVGDALNGQEQGALPDIEAGIDNLSLAPGESVAFTVDYETETPLNAYAIRVSQYAKESDGEKLIGGQTFVKGQVSGFPVRQDKPDGEDSPPTSSEGKNFWWWILALLLAVAFIIILIR